MSSSKYPSTTILKDCNNCERHRKAEPSVEYSPAKSHSLSQELPLPEQSNLLDLRARDARGQSNSVAILT